MLDYELRFALLELQKYVELIVNLTLADQGLTEKCLEKVRKNHYLVGLAVIRMQDIIDNVLTKE